MELTIRNKYINRGNGGNFTSYTLCPYHKVFEDRKLSKSEDLRKLIQFVLDQIEKHEPALKPKFLKSFKKHSKWRKMKSHSDIIKLIANAIWLLQTAIDFATNAQDNEYSISQIEKIQLDILNVYSNDKVRKKPPVQHYAESVLRDNIIHFSEICIKCSCHYVKNFDDYQFLEYKIGNRIDLLQKFLSEDGLVFYDNFKLRLIDVAHLIRQNLRKVEYVVGEKKKLGDIPKYLWTRIYAIYLEDNSKPIYIDSSNNLVNIYYYDEENSDSGEDWSDGAKKYTYLYEGEQEPSPIHKISFENQRFCVLCDAYKKPKEFPKVYLRPRYSRIVEETMENRPHICRNLCHILALHGSRSKCTSRGHEGKYFAFNIQKLRYTKNRMLEFYMGCMDPNSNLSILENGDIRRYIIWTFLDVLGIFEPEKDEKSEESDAS
jgi:hypothetical protein